MNSNSLEFLHPEAPNAYDIVRMRTQLAEQAKATQQEMDKLFVQGIGSAVFSKRAWPLWMMGVVGVTGMLKVDIAHAQGMGNDQVDNLNISSGEHMWDPGQETMGVPEYNGVELLGPVQGVMPDWMMGEVDGVDVVEGTSDLATVQKAVDALTQSNVVKMPSPDKFLVVDISGENNFENGRPDMTTGSDGKLVLFYTQFSGEGAARYQQVFGVPPLPNTDYWFLLSEERGHGWLTAWDGVGDLSLQPLGAGQGKDQGYLVVPKDDGGFARVVKVNGNQQQGSVELLVGHRDQTVLLGEWNSGTNEPPKGVAKLAAPVVNPAAMTATPEVTVVSGIDEATWKAMSPAAKDKYIAENAPKELADGSTWSGDRAGTVLPYYNEKGELTGGWNLLTGSEVTDRQELIQAILDAAGIDKQNGWGFSETGGWAIGRRVAATPLNPGLEESVTLANGYTYTGFRAVFADMQTGEAREAFFAEDIYDKNGNKLGNGGRNYDFYVYSDSTEFGKVYNVGYLDEVVEGRSDSPVGFPYWDLYDRSGGQNPFALMRKGGPEYLNFEWPDDITIFVNEVKGGFPMASVDDFVETLNNSQP